MVRGLPDRPHLRTMQVEDDRSYRYCVYGIGIVSDTPLTMPRHEHEPLCHVACVRAPASLFARTIQGAVFHPLSDRWQRSAVLDDGSSYLSWDTVGEFLVAPDGRRITCRPAARCSADSFQVYMLGQALSFALVQQHIEPLHATVVVVDGEGVAFLGGSAFGKSTLAASFLEAGHRLLTDDLLVVRETAGDLLAYPGPPRLKLFPAMARRFLGKATGVRMNADTGKLIVPLDDRQTATRPVPIRAMYVLRPPQDTCRHQNVSIEALSARDAFIELMKCTFNRRLAGAGRAARQFTETVRLIESVPVRRLAYPRQIERLRDIHDQVLTRLRSA
jgi:hypothetical protein